NAMTHGLKHYRRLLSGDGLKKTTSLYHALREREKELIDALGGDPSPQERIIIADCVKNILFIGSIDRYLMGLKRLVRKGHAHPVLTVRTSLSRHLQENTRTLRVKTVA